MARIAGRHGELYVDLTGSGSAAPVPFLNKYTITWATDKIDVTAFNDANKVTIASLPSTEGDFSGWYDNATPQLYAAATDGLPRKTYVYPDNSTVTTYFFGTAIFDFSIDVDNSGGVAVSGSWAAASSFSRVG